MAIIRQNSISGISSITAQNNAVEFFDSSGVKLFISGTDGIQVATGAFISGTDGIQVATGATISGTTNTITALTNGVERLSVDSDGKMILGTATNLGSVPPKLTIVNNTNSNTFSECQLLRLNGPSGVGERGGIGFHYAQSSDYGEKPSAFIGNETVDAGGGQKSDLIFATRGAITDTEPSERLRIYSDGHGKFNNGAITRVLVVDDDTPSGTSQTYTSIPSWATKITILFDQVSTTGGSELLVQLGTSGGAITSNYDSSSSNSSGTTLETSTAGFVLYVSSGGTSVLMGKMEIQRAGTSNKWISSHVMKNSGNTRDGAGVLTTYSGTIDRVVVTTEGGSNTFDGGDITIYAEA